MQSEPELFEIVDALRLPRGLSRGLYGGKEQGDQDRDDRDDHEKFDQGESGTRIACVHGGLCQDSVGRGQDNVEHYDAPLTRAQSGRTLTGS